MAHSETKSFNVVLMQIVAPALIMAVVGSLVFFLIEVLYRGPHAARMCWVMGLFTIAAVLVSRISIEEGRERAQLFGLALGAATFIATVRLVEFTYVAIPMVGPITTLIMIATVMWCSAKLTWDCTVVDSSRDTTAMGLVERMRTQFSKDPAKPDTATDEEQPDLFARIWKYLTGTQQSNTPGLWVFYFSLVAFPVFGLGQWFVQPGSKTWVFFLFAIYLGSVLCLLATTSLLGLNRYLAKRKLEVPDPIARNWMMLGTGFAATIVLLVLLLPKPAGSSSIQNALAWLQSPDRATTKFAPGKDGNKNDPNAKKKNAGEQGEPDDKVKGDNAKDGEGGDKESKQAKSDQQGDKDSDSKSDENRNGEKNKQDQESENQSQRENQSNDKERKAQQDREQKSDKNAKQQRQNQNNNRNRKDNKNNEQKQRDNQTRKKQQQPPPPEPKSSDNQNNAINKLLETMSKGLKWVVYAIGLAALLFVVWMLRDDLAKLWAQLFGKKRNTEKPEELEPRSAPVEQPPSFANFKNPFRNGKAKSMFGWQLAQYTMSALEAWAREYEIEREPEKTPQEFALQLKSVDKRVSQYAREFADVYGRVAFSPEKVSREDFDPLVQLWDQMSIVLQSKRRQQSLAPQ